MSLNIAGLNNLQPFTLGAGELKWYKRIAPRHILPHIDRYFIDPFFFSGISNLTNFIILI